MAKCDYCDKKTGIGRRSKHRRGVASRKFRNRAKKHSRSFKPNIQKVTVAVGDLKLKMRLCTKCIKALKKKTRKERKELKKSQESGKKEAQKKNVSSRVAKKSAKKTTKSKKK
jgi:ribosomal protein L28